MTKSGVTMPLSRLLALLYRSAAPTLADDLPSSVDAERVERRLVAAGRPVPDSQV